MIAKAISLTSVALLLTGFSAVSTYSPAQSLPKVVAPVNKVESSHRQGYVKPGTAVELFHDYDGQTQRGEIETFTLTLHHIYETGYLTVSVLPTQGLQINSDLNPQQVSLHRGSSFSLPVQVSSMIDGTYYIGVEAVYESLDGQQNRRVLSVPVTIGSKTSEQFQPAKTQESKAAAGGVVALPAREVIK
jgi:hypothetical protein